MLNHDPKLPPLLMAAFVHIFNGVAYWVSINDKRYSLLRIERNREWK